MHPFTSALPHSLLPGRERERERERERGEGERGGEREREKKKSRREGGRSRRRARVEAGGGRAAAARAVGSQEPPAPARHGPQRRSRARTQGECPARPRAPEPATPGGAPAGARGARGWVTAAAADPPPACPRGRPRAGPRCKHVVFSFHFHIPSCRRAGGRHGEPGKEGEMASGGGGAGGWRGRGKGRRERASERGRERGERANERERKGGERERERSKNERKARRRRRGGRPGGGGGGGSRARTWVSRLPVRSPRCPPGTQSFTPSPRRRAPPLPTNFILPAGGVAARPRRPVWGRAGRAAGVSGAPPGQQAAARPAPRGGNLLKALAGRLGLHGLSLASSVSVPLPCRPLSPSPRGHFPNWTELWGVIAGVRLVAPRLPGGRGDSGTKGTAPASVQSPQIRPSCHRPPNRGLAN